MTGGIQESTSPITSAIGKRVTIRLRDPAGGFRDIVGVLQSENLLVNAKSEKVTFNQEEIAIWREIKSLPDRAGTGAPLSMRILELERLSDKTWPAEETLAYGKWRLRISDGHTMRANSVLPTGAPEFGQPANDIAESVADVIKIYQDHNLTPTFTVPIPLFDSLDSYLSENGWRLKIAANFLVRDLAQMAPPENIKYSFEVNTQPSLPWLELQGDHHLESIMLRYPAKYVEMKLGEEIISIGRVATLGGWSIITRLYVIPALRGQGVAKKMMNYLMFVARNDGATKIALQVDSENRAGLALYTGMGFRLHHRYNYRTLESSKSV